MSVVEAIILGVVQGVTEFLPISSTAHVRIVPALVGWDDPGAAFTAVIQLGTLLAVVMYFRKELARAFGGWLSSFKGGERARSAEARLGWAAFVGTVPIVVFGFVFKGLVEKELRSLYVIAAALIGVGLLLLLAETVASRMRGLESVGQRDGWIVGLFQALALIPGVSRSGSTIAGALLLGFDRETAARFSFILSTPAILLAGMFELWSERQHLYSLGMGQVLLGTIAAFISGYVSIEYLLRFLRTRSTILFVMYRIALGGVLLVLLRAGTLEP